MGGGDAPRRSRTIAVLIIAAVRLYREGLAASLAGRDHLSISTTNASRPDALAKVREIGADVVVVDMAVRESLDLVCDLRREALPTKILAFGVEEVTADILDCAEAGAAGYVTADASIDELVTAIERIAREELICSPQIAATLFQRVSEAGSHDGPMTQARSLTNRERQVLRLIQQGYSNKEIAENLNIAEPTVKNHVHHLLEKLEVSTRAQAIARAKLPASGGKSLGLAMSPKRGTG
jgi:two-component system, NarL family, nitrate/nitrite response regulator NarL